MATASRVQSKLARRAKGQEKVPRRERTMSAETKRATALVPGHECEGSSAGARREPESLKERQDRVLEEIVETLTSNRREIWGTRATIPGVKNSKNSNSRKERGGVKGLASRRTELVEKMQDFKIDQGAESLIFKRKLDELSRKCDKAKNHKGHQGEKLPQNYKVRENMGRALHSNNDQEGNRDVPVEVPERCDRENGEQEPAKEAEGRKLDDVKDKGKAPREERPPRDEGMVLTLAAGFSSAELDIGEQWGRIFSVLRENGFEPAFHCKAELAFQCDGEIKTFSDLQSLRKFASQEVFLKDLLKDVLPRNANSHGGERQRRGDKPLKPSECGAGDSASDGLNFLFIKEVKVGRPEGKSSVPSTWKGKGSPKMEEQGAVWLEEEGEENSGMEEVEEGEETWGEEEEEGEEEGEGNSETGEEENSGTDEEEEHQGGGEASRLCEELACSYLLGEEEKSVKLQEVHSTEEEEEMAALGCQEAEAPWPALHVTSLSESLERSSDVHKKGSCANLSALSGVSEFLGKTEKERNKTLQIEELTSSKAQIVQETEENFRRRVVNIFREMQEEIVNIRKHHPGISEIQHSVDHLQSRVGKLEERLSSLDDQMEEVSKDTTQMSKQLMNNEKLRVREDEFRSSNIRVIGVPEKDTKENGAEDIIKEIIEENFSELRKDSSLEVVSAHRVPSKVDERKLTPRHILVTFGSSSEKEKILKASREREEITYRGRRVRLTADLSLSTLDARSQWSDITTALRQKGFHPRIRYPAKLTIDFEGKRRTFSDTDEFRRFVSRVPSLKELLENVL